MAAVDATPIGTKPYEPVDPVDPSHCPTCLSGTPPVDPWYEEAIKIPDARTAG